ncbi:MAG: adenylate/guanylate cyclase domain-containing protein [Bryobacteraceae bacterium]
MNYDGLQTTYWNGQIARVEKLRARIGEFDGPSIGRVVPLDDDLAIGEGRRLSVAVMFLDISSFSQRPSETEAEQDLQLRVLSLFFSEMIKIAEDYGGTVEKNTGDGLMAYFESADGENGSKRAVSCALTMMAANECLIRPILQATPAPEISFRISIDHGWVTIARLGAARRFNANVAIGSTANFAAKMLSFAKAGDIVIGESAKNQLPSQWQISFTELFTRETGWSYRATGRSYPLYRYTGRWAKLI